MKKKFTPFIKMLVLMASGFLLSSVLNKVNAQTYCTPTNASASSTYRLETVSTSGGIINISNITNGFGTNGYNDFTGMEVWQVAGSSFTLSAISAQNSYISMWVDWNQDGDFTDPGENLYNSPNNLSAGIQVIINIPTTTSNGTYRIRVMTDGLTAITGPCWSSAYFECEDYSLKVVSPCSGAPTAGAVDTTDTFNVCSGKKLVLGLTGETAASGMSFQWQMRQPSGTGVWMDVIGATSPSLTMSAGIMDETDFRCYVVCTASSLADTTLPVTARINTPIECYCTPSNVTNTSYYISHFQTTGAQQNVNKTSGFSPNGYGDYHTTDTIIATKGSTVNVSISSLLSSTYYYYVWADWNQDGFFDGPGEQAVYSGGYQSSPYNSSFTVPNSALFGPTRIRVRNGYLGAVDPCEDNPYSEAEDYTIVVIGSGNCSTATIPTNITTLADKDSFCGSGTINLSLDAAFTSEGLSFQWQSSPNGSSNWTNVGSPQVNSHILLRGISATTWYRCQVLCHNSISVTSAAKKISINDAHITSHPDVVHCNPGVITLTATATPGAEVRWYDSPTSATPIHTGTTFTTPYLNNTQTYYVSAITGLNEIPPADSVHSGSITPGQVYTCNDAANGVMFDVTPSTNLNIDSFTMFVGNSSSTYPGPVKVYYKAGTFVGNETNASAWTQVASLNLNFNTMSYITIPLPNSIALDKNTTYGFYLLGNAGFESGTGTYSNSDMAIDDGAALCLEFSSVYSGFRYMGGVYYHRDVTCESSRVPIAAVIAPVPNIQLGHDTTLCADIGTRLILDAGAPTLPNIWSYQWSTGDTTQTSEVNSTGSYGVNVTNQYGCSSGDTIQVSIFQNPAVDLGPDTTICEGQSVTLDAGSQPTNTHFQWSTNARTQTINVTDSGLYIVVVTKAICSTTDTVRISLNPLPHVNGIVGILQNDGSYHYTPHGVRNVQDYYWNFGDGSSSSAPLPEHTYLAGGNYQVTLIVTNDCGADTIVTHIHFSAEAIHQVTLNKDQLKLYPNPAKDIVTLENESSLQMKSIVVYNILGQELFNANTNSPTSYQLNVSGYASGMYNVRILMKNGNWVQRRFEIRR